MSSARRVTSLTVAALTWFTACGTDPRSREAVPAARTRGDTQQTASNATNQAPTRPPISSAPAGLSLWDIWFAGGDQVECSPTLAGLYQAADRVVLGRFEELHVAEVRGEDEARIVMAELRVRVTRSLRSTGPVRSSLPLVLMVAGTREAEARALVKAVQDHLPSGDMLLFLRTNRDDFGVDQGTVRLVCYAGLWTEGPDGARAPLIGDELERYRPELRGLTSVDQLASRLAH